MMNRGMYSTKLTVPFFKTFAPDLLVDRLFSTPMFFLGYLPFLAFVALVLVGSSNTVNLTDGLDGLAIGCTLIAAAALTALTYITGHAKLSEYLDIRVFRRPPRSPISVVRWLAPALDFFGTTRIRPKSSWATSARFVGRASVRSRW